MHKPLASKAEIEIERSRYEKAKRGLIVSFDWITGIWSATHEAFVKPFADAIQAFHRRNAAAAAFPNTHGNYAGKRTEITPAPPMEPRERFNRLAADYTAHAMTYRNPPKRRERNSDRRPASVLEQIFGEQLLALLRPAGRSTPEFTLPPGATLELLPGDVVNVI